ncbi:hypothetical protein IEQ34_022248 [Dendrobium chrysotoxum]|uniref:Aldehyde dehydrogenase domain-containing protein n=1 Tax=Dendrobium chrysotoxum TaxID=161865 RepID=A0AAV7FYI3_DENCH|nr:hypothetical protein IEQ34_022248 [Dendrobium chrysotoxum]
MSTTAKQLTPVVLELGGKCPVVVDSDVDLKVIFSAIIKEKRKKNVSNLIVVGKWGSNNGQACVPPDYIITTKSFAPKLVDALKVSIENFYGENPLQSEDLSRVVNSNHFARLSSLLDDEKVSGKIIHGGKNDEKIAPTLLLDDQDDSLIMQEEIFGPLLPIITVHNVEECFDVINSKPKPLAAYLFSRNKKFEERFVKNFANPNLPFGGVGESGVGSYHGKFSFDSFSHKKAILHRSFGGEVSARYPPYTPQKQKLLRALLTGDIIGLILALFGWPMS